MLFTVEAEKLQPSLVCIQKAAVNRNRGRAMRTWTCTDNLSQEGFPHLAHMADPVEMDRSGLRLSVQSTVSTAQSGPQRDRPLMAWLILTHRHRQTHTETNSGTHTHIKPTDNWAGNHHLNQRFCAS